MYAVVLSTGGASCGSAARRDERIGIDVYDPTNQSGSPSSWTKAVYGIELYFSIGGTVYGDIDTSNPTGIISPDYTLSPTLTSGFWFIQVFWLDLLNFCKL